MNQEMSHEEAVMNQRLGNLKIALLIPISEARSHNRSIEDLIHFLVNNVKAGWTGVETAKQFADAIALNWESFGSEIISNESDDNTAKLVFTDFADDALLEFLNMTRSDADHLYLFIEYMAKELGMTATYERDDMKIVVTVTK